MTSQNPNISLVLLEILRGYSVFTLNNKKFYFKHFLLCENLELQEFQESCLADARKKGIKSESDLLENAIKNNLWSQENEDKCKSLKWMIEKSQASLNKITDNIQRKAFNQNIEKLEKELKQIEEKRSSLLSYSAEQFSEHKKNAKLLKECLFVDKDFNEYASEQEVYDLIPLINKKINLFSNDEIIIRTAYHSSFFEFFNLMSNNPYEILQKNIFEISIWQKKLLTYASILLNKLKNMEMPQEVKQDAVKIFNYIEQTKQTKSTEGVDDLREKMQKNNGKLTAEDLFS